MVMRCEAWKKGGEMDDHSERARPPNPVAVDENANYENKKQ